MKKKYIYILALLLVVINLVFTLANWHVPLFSSVVNVMMIALLAHDITKK
ncbi:hypothetical protein [Enterococcus hirae]